MPTSAVAMPLCTLWSVSLGGIPNAKIGVTGVQKSNAVLHTHVICGHRPWFMDGGWWLVGG